MAYYSYNTYTRQVVEISDSPLSPRDSIATSEVPEKTVEQLLNLEWDENTCSFTDTVKTKFTKREFLKKFTSAEYASIKSVCITNPTIDYYWQLFMLADYVDMRDPDVATALNAMSSVGALTAARVTEILQ